MAKRVKGEKESSRLIKPGFSLVCSICVFFCTTYVRATFHQDKLYA